jgi:hypothetical protein
MYFRVRNLILSLALLWIAASPGQPNPFGFNQEPYSHAQRLVSVGSGRRLNIYCTGKGSPTVILDLGFGAPLISWGLVQPEIAEIQEFALTSEPATALATRDLYRALLAPL